ncbi:NAD(P)/FAD-dependent oxidoreductase [Pontibacter sp. G13]|uniref:NAD(P)/FAD-dependent oxidoreductase n=1 Tax=Pontibacter sp. G13 TaxID=3074898 RepID=UPI00288AC9A6|nr:NAD(P)/FAD-dependent oxidoreductase [Pontibacter sp. G13]WNJ19970.1 NAD(P)/FAD-dependent oxidoreductase [Pontibacter sp. G13]
MIQTDICIVGAGPVGLFAVFEAGLLKMKCHLVDYLPQTGGQLTEIYPKKPIYDIPGYPSVLAGDLITNLEEQIAPFEPTYTLGERMEKLEKQADGSFILTTSEGTEIHSKVVVIAGGLGCFEPRKPVLDRLDEFERKGVDYIVKDPEKYRDKKVIIAGGGDSALDWTVFLADVASEVSLIHRREEFRGAPDTAQKVMQLAEEGKVKIYLNSQVSELSGDEHLSGLEIKQKDGTIHQVDVDYFIPLFGLSPKLGPIAEWGLNISKRAVEVDTRDYSTNVPGVYAIGDINTYPGKLKLILCGFHEAALMAHSAFSYIYPDKKSTLKYTTVTGISGM